MRNLYSLNKNKNTVATMYRVLHNRTVHIDPLPGIFPNYTAPVVRHTADGEREMALAGDGHADDLSPLPALPRPRLAELAETVAETSRALPRMPSKGDEPAHVFRVPQK